MPIKKKIAKNRYNSHTNLLQKTRLKNKNSEVTQDIADIQKLWNEKADVVPIIIVALFTIKKIFEKQMKKLNIPIAIPCFLKATLSGTVFVLRRLVALKVNEKKEKNNCTINK